MIDVENSIHYFLYSVQGELLGRAYRDEVYLYRYNALGDIIGIIDKNGNSVVEYQYDTWGVILATTGNMAASLGKINPFRYRGYIYDEETGFYYLKSRYYNPEIGKFLNADSVVDSGSILGLNMYAYCKNDPVNYTDPTGYYFTSINSSINSVESFTVVSIGGWTFVSHGASSMEKIGVGGAGSYRPSQYPSYSKEEIEFVATIYSETSRDKNKDGIPDVGWRDVRAIGHSVMNRLDYPDAYGGSLMDILTADGQYRGRGNQPYREMTDYMNLPASQRNDPYKNGYINTLIDIKTGKSEDFTGGAVSFNKDKSGNAPNNTIPLKIKDVFHTFYKRSEGARGGKPKS